MIKNKIEIIEINEDFEKSKLNSSNTNKNIEKELNLKDENQPTLSQYLFLIIVIIVIGYIIIKNIHIPKQIQNIPFSPSTPLLKLSKKNEYYKMTPYDKKGQKIYSSTGTLSFNKLDEIYYGKKEKISKYNHIHVAMSFNNDYHLLSTVTIASLLKNAKKTTYIHLHIIAVDGFIYPTMKKLNSLKSKINNNTEFIFHNGDRVQKDLGKHTKDEQKGVGEYARLLAPYFVNDTDRIIITDSADLLIKKDLFELYNYPLEDKLVKGVIDPYTKCFPEYYFFHKENYFNGGVLLFNAKRWREMNLYQDIVNFYKGFKYKGRLPTPIQDILNTFFPAASIGLLPLKYNFQGYVYLHGEEEYPYNNIYELECSIFYKKKKKLIKVEKDLVIRHCNKYKVYTGEASYEVKKEWQYYAKMTGFYDELCENYPQACEYL